MNFHFRLIRRSVYDAVGGVDDSFDKTVETVTKVAEATKNYVTETLISHQSLCCGGFLGRFCSTLLKQ